MKPPRNLLSRSVVGGFLKPVDLIPASLPNRMQAAGYRDERQQPKVSLIHISCFIFVQVHLPGSASRCQDIIPQQNFPTEISSIERVMIEAPAKALVILPCQAVGEF